MRSGVTWTMIALLAAGCPQKDEADDTGSVPAVDSGTDDSGTVGDTDTPEPTTPFSAFEDADLTNGNTVRQLAILSAEQMYARAFLTVISSAGSDPKCPVVSYPTPYETTVVGGCTAADGIEWTGSAQFVGSVAGDLTAVYSDGFGYLGAHEYCTGVGYVEVDQALTGTIAFGADGSFSLSLGGLYTEVDPLTCVAEARNFVLDYAGQLQELVTYDDQYDGAGEYGDDRHGHVTAQTFAQLEIGGGCGSEADAGSTLLSTPDHDATITYDGATDCDKVGTAIWALDSVPQGELIGIGCSSTPAALGWVALVPLLLAFRRRGGAGAWLDGVPQGELLGVTCSSTPASFGWLAVAPLLAVRRRVTSA